MGQISRDISDTLISGLSRLKRLDLLMTTLLPKHFLCCRVQCYTHNLPECNWSCPNFLLLRPLCPATRDHKRIWPKMFSILFMFYSHYMIIETKQSKKSWLTEKLFVCQDSSHRAKVLDYSPGDTIVPCVPGSDSISYVPPPTPPTNLTILETIITWASLSDAFTDSCVMDYEVVSLLSGSN